MATVKKTIGRLPVYKGDWVAGTYSMLNQVSYLGSTFQSKIDNNTAIPATVVNNALQVNANWSVVSNGTAAYLADSRLTACETASTYAQAGVDTLRSDVQGCGFSINKVNEYWLYNASEFTISFWVITDPIAANKDIFIFGSSSPITGSSIYGGYNGAPIIFTQFSPRIDYNSNILASISKGFYALTFNNGAAQWYFNGQPRDGGPVTGFNPTQTIYKISSDMQGRNFHLGNIRTFNTALTQQQIDTLYNQGRCDEVVLGDEWRSRMMSLDFNDYSLWSLSGGATYNDATKEFSIITSGDTAGILPTYNTTTTSDNSVLTLKTDQISMIEFEAKGSGDIKAVSGDNAIFLIGQHRITLTNDWVRYMVAVKGNGTSNSIALVRYGGALNATIRNVVISNPKLLNEYTPKYLTKTNWIDSGVNKQDIALTAPTFTYVKPYKQYSFGSGVPTTPPNAAFVEYSDTTTGNIWKGTAKPNTRQFAVSDWKQINN